MTSSIQVKISVGDQPASAVADPARVRDPNRKGSVENAIQGTQSTAST